MQFKVCSEDKSLLSALFPFTLICLKTIFSYSCSLSVTKLYPVQSPTPDLTGCVGQGWQGTLKIAHGFLQKKMQRSKLCRTEYVVSISRVATFPPSQLVSSEPSSHPLNPISPSATTTWIGKCAAPRFCDSRQYGSA